MSDPSRSRSRMKFERKRIQTTKVLAYLLGSYEALLGLPFTRAEVEMSYWSRHQYASQAVPSEKRLLSNVIDFSSSPFGNQHMEACDDFNAEDVRFPGDEMMDTVALSLGKEYRCDDLSSHLLSSSWRRSTCDKTTTTISTNASASSTAKVRHTGTTIAGCIAENGKFVVIAADSRATEDSTVADKKCEKVHKLTENIWCCGAGTSADNDALMRQIHYSFLLDGIVKESIGNRRISSENPYHEKRGIANVSAVCRRIRNILYGAKGNLGVNLVLGGYDFSSDQALLAAIHPHGSIDLVPFTALGSGGLAAMGVLEISHRYDMSLDEAINLVKAAIAAGISNDLGSGSQIDLCIIGRDRVRYYRAYVTEEELPETESDKANADKLHSRHRSGEEDQRSGVGGFGSLPFSIKSTRMIMQSDEDTDKSRRKWLEETLDL